MPSLDAGTVWRAASFIMLCWLAAFFGRTLRAGQMPLIERIARVSDPDIKPALRRYTRLLTAVWCAYFVLAALVALAADTASFLTGVWVGAGSVVLFVGEHWLRHRIFPGERFPGLAQQVRDTWAVWSPRKRISG